MEYEKKNYSFLQSSSEEECSLFCDIIKEEFVL